MIVKHKDYCEEYPHIGLKLKDVPVIISYLELANIDFNTINSRYSLKHGDTFRTFNWGSLRDNEDKDKFHHRMCDWPVKYEHLIPIINNLLKD